MWTTTYIISQILSVSSYIVFSISLCVKDRNKILIINILDSVLYGTHYLLLGAYAGAVIYAIGIIRCLWYYIENIKGIKRNYISLFAFMIFIIVSTILTITSISEIIPLIIGIIFTYAVWQDKVIIYRYIITICSVLLIAYNIIHLSVFAIILESVLLIFEVFSIFKYYYDSKHNKVNNVTNSENDVNENLIDDNTNTTH